MKVSKVMVSGCFDTLHPGHIAFLESAAQFGQLHVCIGNDDNVLNLKSRPTYFNEQERAYMISALNVVHQVRISKGNGQLDFMDELNEIMPDIFVVNEDGHSEAKRDFIESKGVEYKILYRTPKEGLPSRSTTQYRTETEMPFRIDLAGGWLDQPFVSEYCAGSVVTISILPTINFNSRSGMASSTRNTAISMWGKHLPNQDYQQMAKLLFAADNPPGKKNVSGSQDAIGIVFPGLNKLDYDREYWPLLISSVLDEDIISWLENHLFLIPIGPREDKFEVLDQMHLDSEGAMNLANAAAEVWSCILSKDLKGMGKAMTASFKAQCQLFPLMTNENAEAILKPIESDILGYKISGAGGGGYWVVVSEFKMDSFVSIKIRR
jgi:cytidyltransferase-like protein